MPTALPYIPRFQRPVAGDDGKAFVYDLANKRYVHGSFEAAGAVATHAALVSGVHGISAFGATLVGDADAATARNTLGLGALATSGVPGATTQVISNQAGVLAGDAGLTYDAANDALTVAGRVVTPIIRPASDSTTAVRVQNAAGSTSVLVVDTTNGSVGVNTTPTNGFGFHLANKSAWFESPNQFLISRADGAGFRIRATSGGNKDWEFTTSDAVVDGTGSWSKMASSTETVDKGLLLRGTSATSGTPSTDGRPLFLPTARWTGTAQSIEGYAFRGYRNSSTSGDYYLALESGTISSRTIRLRFTSGGDVAIGNVAPTAALDLPASTTARASARIRAGTAPTSPNDGDVWFDGTDFKCRIGGVTKTFTVT